MTEPKAPGANCSECPLQNMPFAPTSGPRDAKIAIVSRSPARGDCINGKPFSGMSGKLLNALLEMNGVERKDCLVTNVVLCQCDKPPKAAISACQDRLSRDLSRVQGIRLACGSEAARALVGASSVLASRGHIVQGKDGKPCVVTYNPAAALRDDSSFPSLVKDFKRALQPPQLFSPPNVYWTENTVDAELIYESLRGRTIAVDIEATGLAHTSKPLSISFSPSGTTSYVVGRYGLWGTIDSLARLLQDTTTTLIWHNGKYDIQVLRNAGIETRVDEDTMLLSYSCDERPAIHVALESLLYDEFDWPSYEPDHIKKGKKVGFENLTEEQWPDLYVYNGFDTAGCFRLYEVLKERAREDNSLAAYYSLLIPGANAYARIETRGVLFDTAKALEVRETDIAPKLASLQASADEAAGFCINLNSPKQCAEYLYDHCGLDDPQINFNVERSTDEQTRKFLLANEALDDNVRKWIVAFDEFKQLDKLRGTYIDGLIKRVDRDGRLRASYKLHGTETGRRSAEKPNLQNQPRGPQIRQFYIAPVDYKLLSVDYSQAELRTAAVLSQDPAMLEIYRDGRDFHSETARKFYGERFTKENRFTAKTINFGVFYGQGAEAFSTMYGIPYGEAADYIRGFWGMFPRAAAWKRKVEKTILTCQELTSAFGRKRRFHLITPQNKDSIIREGTNFIISSVAADFTLWSLIELENKLGNVLLEVHDSLLFESPTELVDQHAHIIRDVMEHAPVEVLHWNEIPFEVDVQVGDNWGYMNELPRTTDQHVLRNVR